MIEIYKSKRLLIYTGKTHFECPVSLGAAPIGHKQAEGDGRTPEGRYRICTVNRQSKFCISLGISYPGTRDAVQAFRAGKIRLLPAAAIAALNLLRMRPLWNTPLGGFVMLHGESPDGKKGDWTQGCIALSNADIKTLASLCGKGERVNIYP